MRLLEALNHARTKRGAALGVAGSPPPKVRRVLGQEEIVVALGRGRAAPRPNIPSLPLRRPTQFSDIPIHKPTQFSEVLVHKPTQFSDVHKPTQFSDVHNATQFSDVHKPTLFSGVHEPTQFSDVPIQHEFLCPAPGLHAITNVDYEAFMVYRVAHHRFWDGEESSSESSDSDSARWSIAATGFSPVVSPGPIRGRRRPKQMS